MNISKKSLTPAQLNYFKVSPKLQDPNSDEAKRLIEEALMEKVLVDPNSGNSIQLDIKKISKGSIGGCEKTVRNFGVLMNKNFGSETNEHKVQKFGEHVRQLNTFILKQEKNEENSFKKVALQQKIKERSDSRTFLKAIYEYAGVKLYVTLKSFQLEVIQPNTGSQGLPIPYLRFMTEHINSNRLVSVVESALKLEGNQIAVEYEKIESKCMTHKNSETRYAEVDYAFERLGQELKLVPPCLQIVATDINFNQVVGIDNIDILKTLDTNIGNVEELVLKYLHREEFEKCQVQARSQIQQNAA